MSTHPSYVLLTTPTSGTGSLWRILSSLTQGLLLQDKVTERLANAAKTNEIANWKPEKTGHIYMYNTSYIENYFLNDESIRLIVNARDPRDMACNQYFWALQHPKIGNFTEEQIARERELIKEKGIDNYALEIDNNIQFKAHKAVLQRLLYDRKNTLCISYNQLCLDLEGMVRRLAEFLGPAANTHVIPAILEAEKIENLKANKGWIGNLWTGHDTGPGRHKMDLEARTIAEIDARYADVLGLLKQIELPHFRHYYGAALGPSNPARAEVLYGHDGYLFLANDTNRVIEQVQGELGLDGRQRFEIAQCHRWRQHFLREEANADYLHVIVPNKEMVLPHLLPYEVRPQSLGLTPVNAYFEDPVSQQSQSFYRPNLLRRMHDIEPAFCRRDTHWTHFGALAYVEQAFRSGGMVDAADAFASNPREPFEGKQAGDLGSKVGAPPESIRLIRPTKPQAKWVFTNGIVNEGCVRLSRNASAPIAERLLLLHDSTALWLIDFLAETFAEVFAIHTPDMDPYFVSRYRPNRMLFIQIERFFMRRPKNDVSFHEFVGSEQRRKGAKNCALSLLSEPHGFAQAA